MLSQKKHNNSYFEYQMLFNELISGDVKPYQLDKSYTSKCRMINVTF